MFKRILAVTALAATIGASTFAAPVFPRKHTITQPDGSTLTLRMVGDERFHCVVTDDARPVVRNNKGEFVYLLNDGQPSSVSAHNLADRSAAEVQFLNENRETISLKKLQETRLQKNPYRWTKPQRIQQRIKSRAAATSKAPMADTFTDCPTSGNRKIPVILVQFSDLKFQSSNPVQAFQSYFNEGDGSGRKYFIDNSNGAYQPQFDLYGPVTLPKNHDYYGANDSYGSDSYVGELIAYACNNLDSKINFSDYDTNSDGYVDAVIILYAGNGEQYDASWYSSEYDDLSNCIWPHQYYLSESDYGKTLTLDGVKIDLYGCFNETYGENLSSKKQDGIGVFCHEFSHALGLPDLYETNDYEMGYYGMGNWSLMCGGCYNNDGYTPVGYSGYDKAFMGWIDLQEAQDNTQYTLPAFNSGTKANDQVIKITNPSDANEYIVIENRAKQGWDKYMAAEGLLIYRVSYNQSDWLYNKVNNTATGRYVPICADNILSDKTEAGDLWPYSTATELTATSTPAMKSYSGKAIDRPITEITRNSDGTISFWFAKEPIPSLPTPTLASHSGVTPTGFTANWQHNADVPATYTLEVTTHSDVSLLMDVNFAKDQHNWTTTNSAGYDDGDDAIRLGASKKTGAVTSPEFTIDDSGITTISFLSKLYSNPQGTPDSSVSARISLLDVSGNTITSKTQTITNTADFSTFTLTLNGTPGSKAKIQIASVANKKRFYIKSAQVYGGDATETISNIKAKAPSQTGDANKRTITGITELSHTVEGLAERGCFDYRVKAVPVDPTIASESKWSAKQTVDLSTAAIIGIDADATTAEPARYYNLQGIEISADNLTPGIYIRRQGSHAEKIVVR